MMTSFKRKTDGPAAKPATAPTPAPAEPELPLATVADHTTTLALPTRSAEGEFLAEDLVVPKLNLVQAVGPLSEAYTPGHFVFNREVDLSDGTEPLSVTALRIRKQYCENLPYGSDELPRVLDTLEQVRAAGGWIEWRDNDRPPFSPILHAMILIRSPFEEHPLFPHSFGGESYGLGLWTLRGVGFTRAGKTLITASQLALRDGLHTGGWSLASKREKIGVNFVHVPVLRHDSKHAPEFAEFALGVLG